VAASALEFSGPMDSGATLPTAAPSRAPTGATSSSSSDSGLPIGAIIGIVVAAVVLAAGVAVAVYLYSSTGEEEHKVVAPSGSQAVTANRQTEEV
jgi:hypothetical protein